MALVWFDINLYHGYTIFMHSKTTNSLYIFNRYLISLVLLFNSHLALAVDFSEEIKSYIINIKSIAVEFEQSDANGQIAHGMLIIDKPYKFRCNYYEPFPIVIVGNKNYISVYDYEMENLSRIKADENIFHFLLVDKVSFDDQFEVLLAKEQGKNYIIKLKHHGLNKVSEIVFEKESKQIQAMKIFEENNVITLAFGKTHIIRDVAKSLFIMRDPDIFDKPERLNRLQLQKKFKE
ncbi:MAG: outer membrane lipoprotein carrier protein LolA [Rickettsiaceae bacterium]|nr:outer membrane lipoprotein carrier protein LolA [Rickettsiaceae bacterium]